MDTIKPMSVRDRMTDVPRGSLNPEFHLWLMGWPEGWTALEPLETAKFQQWLASHGASSQESNNP